MSKSLIITLLSIGLLACSSSPEKMSYYTLHEATQKQVQEVTADAYIVALTEISVADYLMQARLAMLSKQHQIYFSPLHGWAESLDLGLEKSLIQDLNELQGEQQFVGGQSPWRNKRKFELQINVDDFVPTHNSEVIFTGEFTLLNSRGEPLLSRSFNLRRDLAEDGYGHSVSVMRKMVKLLAQDIARALSVLQRK